MTSHNESPSYAEFHQLMVDLLDRRLGDEQYARLMQLLHENPELREEYTEQMALHSLLLLNHRDPLTCNCEPEPPAPPAIAPLLSVDDWPNLIVEDPNNASPPPSEQGFFGFLTRSLEFGSRLIANPAHFTILILIFMITPLALIFFLDHRADKLTVISSPMVAKLNRQSADAQWATSENMPKPGMELPQGKVLVLEKGLAEIEFKKGATVLLQGPITYRLDGSNASFLQKGRMTAQVPQSASGFSVFTPNTKVIDLGTEFGVSVDTQESTEVHVFVGKVELSPDADEAKSQQPEKYFLNAGQAIKVSTTNTGNAIRSKPFVASPQKYARHIDSKPTPRSKVIYAHYGNTDPTREGWTVRGTIHSQSNSSIWKNTLLPTEAFAVNNNGIPAWTLQSHEDKREIRCAFSHDNDAGREIAKKGREQGWIMRARIMVEDAGPDTSSSAYCIYVDQGRSWPLFTSIDPSGKRYVDIHGNSSLGDNPVFYPLPNTNHRYVDYEVRYNPKTKNADVFIDGKCVATAFSNEEELMTDGFYFGLQKRKSKARFALVEWELLENTLTTEQSRGK